MASSSIRRRLIRGLIPALLACAGRLSAHTPVSLQEAAARRAGDFLPVHENEEVQVTGTVTARTVRVLTYSHVGIYDGRGAGLTLDGPYELLAALHPGDIIEVDGIAGQRAGLPVLFVQHIRKTGHTRAAPPLKVRWNELNSFRYLGMLVTTEGKIVELGANTGGQYILIGQGDDLLKLFLPKDLPNSDGDFHQYSLGDKIQVTGLASQYCPSPPYDRLFQILLASASDVTLLERSWLVPPHIIGLALLAALLALAVWWTRERRLNQQRRAMRALNALGEEILSASSPAEILEKLNAVVPSVLRITSVSLYVFRPGQNALERIASRDLDGAMIPLETPDGALHNAASLCFRNRTLLTIPDTARSPLFRGAERDSDPRAAMFVPMFAQSEPLGVLALCHSERARIFNQDEQAAAQHFGNQIATSLRLMEQRTMREQLFRSEKLAATGQLISGIADELQAPLESVVLMAGRALTRPADSETKRQLAAIAAEARRASEIVSRLVSFGRAEKTDAKPVEINAVLASLIHFREREWAARNIQVSNRLSMEPVYVMGSQGQLEQVFLNLLVHAEQSLGTAEHRELYVSTSMLARRVLTAISYSGTEIVIRRDPFADLHSAEAGALGLGVCRGIIQSHGGEIRFVRVSGSASRFEVELPVAQTSPGLTSSPGAERGERHWTALVVEPDLAVQRQLLVRLSAKGCRVVPVPQPEEAAQLVERMKFDLLFCSVRLDGSNWLEFYERVRHHVGAFILLTEGYDSDLARSFHAGDGRILRKPVDEKELENLLADLEARAEKNVSK